MGAVLGVNTRYHTMGMQQSPPRVPVVLRVGSCSRGRAHSKPYPIKHTANERLAAGISPIVTSILLPELQRRQQQFAPKQPH